MIGLPSDVVFLKCGNNKLTMIDFCPEIRSSLDCSYNKITSLSGLPSVSNFNLKFNDNLLTSLIGGPRSVFENFELNDNYLTDLNGAPEFIGKNFHVSRNNLTSLYGISSYIGANFDCHNINLIDISDIWDSIIGGTIYIRYNENLAMLPLVKFNVSIKLIKFNMLLEKNMGSSKQNILDLQYDLIENGFGNNAKWKP